MHEFIRRSACGCVWKRRRIEREEYASGEEMERETWTETAEQRDGDMRKMSFVITRWPLIL